MRAIYVLLSLLPMAQAWVSSPPSAILTRSLGASSQVICQAGFGGDSGKKKQKETKLKPKQQWDRFLAMKKSTKYNVAVRDSNDGESEWLAVGTVKSQENKYTEIAVARQRALIADHARRLFPGKISQKTRLEWGVREGEEGGWGVVDKKVLEEQQVPEGIEKIVGFAGVPDPKSGFYCLYDEGRLVNSESEVQQPSKWAGKAEQK